VETGFRNKRATKQKADLGQGGKNQHHDSDVYDPGRALCDLP
jgi:hypothetical protein